MSTNEEIFLNKQMLDYLLRGMPAVVWKQYSKIVEANVKNITSTRDVAVKYNAVEEGLSIRGGIRAPHLHYNGEIYLLNKEQWNKFSGEIIKDFSKKLAETKSVNFSQLMELSEVMSEIV